MRPLGKSGIQASVVALGTWAVGGGQWWGPSDDHESIRAIQASIDAGINLIDTAPMYGFGHSEEIVGQAIKGRRDRVVVATKAGLWWQDQRGSKWFVYEGHTVRRSLRPDTIQLELEASLRRLGVDCIDLYQMHWPALAPELTPIAETMACLLKLKQQGKIRAIGASNVTAALMKEYLAVGQLDANQPFYNILNREIEAADLPFCQEQHIAVLAYSPLEQGLLTGKVTMATTYSEGEYRAGRAWFRPQNRERVLKMLAGWQPLCAKYACTVSQLVTAWTFAQPGLTHVLCGARKLAHVEENAGAGDLELEAADLARLRQDAEALGAPQ